MSMLSLTLLLAILAVVLADEFTYKPAIDNEEFPWFCTVYDNTNFKPVCYCTILGKNAILSAAKCFKDEDIKVDKESKFHIRFGSIAANGMRKFVQVKTISNSGNQHLVMLRPKNPILGFDEIELAESVYKNLQVDNITIATFHSYGTSEPMKTHVHMVTTKVSENVKNCEFAFEQHHFCAVESTTRCNVGLGAGVVSVSPKNSSRWVLHGVAVQSPKCHQLGENSKLADVYVKIQDDKWKWIRENMN
uniref:Salivary serine protease n=1 Tax=Simulium vittatum TaxID=7192 RepID=B5M0P5_SIMVI|nr:salivary serine protease [Simulium vittatum]